MMALLGSNGAGKSTLARAISGLVPTKSGIISFAGREIQGMSAYKIRRMGLTYIPEGRGIFPGLSVNENLRMAVGQEKRVERQAAIDRAIEMFPVLGERRSQQAGSLSGGEQQMLALARALAVPPRLIIADEMSLGLAPIVTEAVFKSLDEARKSGITILLIEQFVERALRLADHCAILTRGEVGWSGPVDKAEHEVLERYLGTAEGSVGEQTGS
jgi:branched-chain amino acid transport system ATP-binding protein